MAKHMILKASRKEWMSHSILPTVSSSVGFYCIVLYVVNFVEPPSDVVDFSWRICSTFLSLVEGGSVNFVSLFHFLRQYLIDFQP